MKKKNIIFWGCAAAMLLGLGVIAGGLAINVLGVTIAALIVGGVLIAGGLLVGVPHAFLEDYNELQESIKHEEKDVVVKDFENKKQKEEEKIVVENNLEHDNSKELDDGREL